MENIVFSVPFPASFFGNASLHMNTTIEVEVHPGNQLKLVDKNTMLFCAIAAKDESIDTGCFYKPKSVRTVRLRDIRKDLDVLVPKIEESVMEVVFYEKTKHMFSHHLFDMCHEYSRRHHTTSSNPRLSLFVSLCNNQELCPGDNLVLHDWNSGNTICYSNVEDFYTISISEESSQHSDPSFDEETGQKVVAEKTNPFDELVPCAYGTGTEDALRIKCLSDSETGQWPV